MQSPVASLSRTFRSAVEKTLDKVIHFHHNSRFRSHEVGLVLTHAILRGQSIHAVCKGYRLCGGLPDGSVPPDDDIPYYRLRQVELGKVLRKISRFGRDRNGRDVMAVDTTMVKTVPKAPTPLQVSMGCDLYGLRFFVVSEFNRTDSGVTEPVVSIRLQTQLEGSAEMLLDTGSARLLLGDGEYSSKECVKVLYDKLDAGEIEGLIVRGNPTWLGLSADDWREGEVRKMAVYGRGVDVCCLVMGRGKDRKKGFLIGAGKYGSFDNYRDRWRVETDIRDLKLVLPPLRLKNVHGILLIILLSLILLGVIRSACPPGTAPGLPAVMIALSNTVVNVKEKQRPTREGPIRRGLVKTLQMLLLKLS